MVSYTVSVCAKPREEDGHRVQADEETHGVVCALASSEVGVAVYPESKAIAYDGDTWSGWLSVSDDFGCVMWEERVEDGEEDQV